MEKSRKIIDIVFKTISKLRDEEIESIINKEGKLVLVDYKTDYVENGNVAKLEEKYKVQLDLYKEALEQALNRKVDKMGLYSLYLNRTLEVKS